MRVRRFNRKLRHGNNPTGTRGPTPIVLRASNSDRERVAAMLRQHYSEGRLTLGEFEDRIEKTYGSRTVGELDELTRDLPAQATSKPAGPTSRRRAARNHVVTYLLVMLLLVAIWALSGAGYFWPLWPMLGWGIGVASDVLGVKKPSGSCSGRMGR